MISAAIARGRAAAERRMVDACVIRRKTGEQTDGHSGVVTPIFTVVYAGACEIQSADAQGRGSDVGEAYGRLLRLVLKVPVAVTGVEAEDLAEVTASRDPDLVGRFLRVRDLMHKTYGTARRLGVEEWT